MEGGTVEQETRALMPRQTIGGDGPLVSRVALGCMGLSGVRGRADYGPECVRRAASAVETALEVGITLFDHADIYGGGTCEHAFGDWLAATPGARQGLCIATKCGIRPGHYNLSHAYVLQALDRSLERLRVEYVDLYQLHRPDPLTHPKETARALSELVRQGRVRHVGVSNYHPEQVRALQTYLDVPIRSNQISISLRQLAPIYEGPEGQGGDGVLDQCMARNMTPLAYSPLAGGRLTGRRAPGDDARLASLLKELEARAGASGAAPAQIALAWLLAHPAGIIPLVGSADPDHIREAAAAVDVDLPREEWYALWVAARGERVP